MMITLAIDHGAKRDVQKGLLCDGCKNVALVLTKSRKSLIGFIVPEQGSGWHLSEGRSLLLGLHLCPSCKVKQRQRECPHLRCEAGSKRCLDCGSMT